MGYGLKYDSDIKHAHLRDLNEAKSAPSISFSYALLVGQPESDISGRSAWRISLVSENAR